METSPVLLRRCTRAGAVNRKNSKVGSPSRTTHRHDRRAAAYTESRQSRHTDTRDDRAEWGHIVVCAHTLCTCWRTVRSFLKKERHYIQSKESALSLRASRSRHLRHLDRLNKGPRPSQSAGRPPSGSPTRRPSRRGKPRHPAPPRDSGQRARGAPRTSRIYRAVRTSHWVEAGALRSARVLIFAS